MNRATPLEGTTVLDFCWIGAGAFVTKALAELGAQVVRIESRTRPDNLRLAPPFRPGTEGLEGSGYFASRNPSKKSVAINMASEEGRDIARALADQVDIVTSNFRPGVMERWGFGYETLAERNPRLVYLTMPMQGADGPHATYIGFGSTIAALSGLVHLTGVEGRLPVGTGTHYPDHVPSPGHALVAVLAAVLHQRRTGEGQAVELSQFESAVNVLGPAFVEHALDGQPGVVGNRMASASPRGAFRTRDDKWIVLACHDEAQWDALTKLLELDLSSDDRFASLRGRKQHEDDLEPLVAEAVARREAAGLLDALETAGVPNSLVRDSRDIFEDPVLEDRGFWEPVDHPVIGEMPISRMPFRFVGTDPVEIERPPLLGEHTWEVLSSMLDLERDRFDELVEREILV